MRPVTFLCRYNRLLTVIIKSLHDLLKALKGLVVMSQQLEEMANSIFVNQVPSLWAGKVRSVLPNRQTDRQTDKKMFDKKFRLSGVPQKYTTSYFSTQHSSTVTVKVKVGVRVRVSMLRNDI